MKQYAAWQAPFYSLWSKSFYVDVVKNWHGLAYAYLFFLICFTWVFMSIKKQMDVVYFIDHNLSPAIEQMPTVTIEKGQLSIDRSSPFVVKDTGGQPVITFDTREKPMTIDEAPGSFLITRDSIYGKNQPSDQKLDLSTIKDRVVIDKKVAHQFVADFTKSIGLIVFMVAVPLAFIFCVAQSLIYALLGIFIARLNKIEMTYGALVRLCAVTLTPVLLIDSIIKVRGLDAYLWPIWWILAIIITVSYIIFAIYANVEAQSNISESANP